MNFQFIKLAAMPEDHISRGLTCWCTYQRSPPRREGGRRPAWTWRVRTPPSCWCTGSLAEMLRRVTEWSSTEYLVVVAPKLLVVVVDLHPGSPPCSPGHHVCSVLTVWQPHCFSRSAPAGKAPGWPGQSPDLYLLDCRRKLRCAATRNWNVLQEIYKQTGPAELRDYIFIRVTCHHFTDRCVELFGMWKAFNISLGDKLLPFLYEGMRNS